MEEKRELTLEELLDLAANDGAGVEEIEKALGEESVILMAEIISELKSKIKEGALSSEGLVRAAGLLKGLDKRDREDKLESERLNRFRSLLRLY